MQQIPLTNFSKNQVALWEAPIHTTWQRKIIDIFGTFNSYAKSMLNASSKEMYFCNHFWPFWLDPGEKITKKLAVGLNPPCGLSSQNY